MQYIHTNILAYSPGTCKVPGIFMPKIPKIHKGGITIASIRKRGNTYQITVSNGRRIDGSQIIETATFTPDPARTERQNQKALEIFALKFEDQVKSGKYLDGEKITFQAFSERYLEEYAVNHLEKNTLAQYRALLDHHILPVIGHLKLAKIQPRNLNSLYNQLLKERKDGKPGGYSARTIRHVHNTISAIYTVALRWNVVMDNPCERVEPPRNTAKEEQVKHFTLEQATAFLEAINKPFAVPISAHDRVDDTGKPYHVDAYTEERTVSTQFRLFFNLALFCGMRRGELIALEWSDLDFAASTVSVTKSSSAVDGQIITKAPKTAAGVRVISVPASVMAMVKQYRKEWIEYRLSLGSAWEGANHVFIQWNGRQMYPSTPYNMFKKILRWYNADHPTDPLPDIPLHGLRHTSATLLISQHVDVRTVSGRLGHAQTSTTTDIYSHFLKKADTAAADTLEDLFSAKAR